MITTRVNLLPSREERRKEQQMEFIALLLVAAALGGLVYLVLSWHANQGIAVQQQRNAYIEQQVAVLDKEISEIKELEARKSELVERMRVIQELQGNRPTIVYVFDELARTLPDGIVYTEVSRTGDTYKISGIAESNNRIASLMRNFNESLWFSDPVLSTVEAAPGTAFGDQANLFALTVRESKPETEEEGESRQ